MEYFKPFVVDLSRRCEPDEHTDAHDAVIAPLLRAALAAYVYKGSSHETQSINLAGKLITHVYEPLNLGKFDFLTQERGKFRFDLTRECVRGAEILWNSRCWARGSVVIVLDEEFDLLPILEHCGEIGISDTPNMGESAAAIKLAKKSMSEGRIAITFSASNGIEWMQIYAPLAVQEQILRFAN